jgi:hypothetical protein
LSFGLSFQVGLPSPRIRFAATLFR